MNTVEPFLRHTPVCSAVLDAEWRIIDANASLCDLLGVKEHELAGRSISDFIDKAALMDALVRYANGEVGRGPPPEVRYGTAKNGKGWCLLAIGQWRAEGTGQNRYLLQISDVTARREREQALTHVHRVAQQMSIARNEFMRNLSHELRTPLNGIFGMVDLLTGSRLDGEQRSHLDTLRASAGRLANRVDDLLDFAALEHGELQLAPAVIDLAAEWYSLEGSLSTFMTNAEVSFDFSSETNGTRFARIDARRLRQIVGCLVSNAFKFTQHGSVSVDATWLDGHIIVTVADTGPGIASEQIETIFDEFSQIDGSVTRRHGGVGLGLTLARRLARTMGGDITVTSIVGAGSTFCARVSAPAHAHSEKAADVGLPLAGLRLLVAEDDPTNQLVVRKLLEREGASVTVVEDGQKAIDAFDEGRFDVALLDVQMPVLSGMEVAQRIAQRVYPNKFPMIAATAHHSSEVRTECERAGMFGFISKPMRRETLVAEIQRVAALARAGVQAEVTPAQHQLPAIDWRRIEQLFSSNEEELRELLTALLSSVTESRKTLEQAQTLRDCERLRRAAHSIRGTVSSIGNNQAADLARQVELAAKDGTINEIAISALCGEVERIQKEANEGLAGARR